MIIEMDISVLVDIDTDRKTGFNVTIQQVMRTRGDKLIRHEEADTISLMAALCEGICTLIHVAHDEKIKPSHESVKDCIKHITDGFADASYTGKLINKINEDEKK